MNFERTAPILPVRDVEAAFQLYTRLGFDGSLYSERNSDGRHFYAILWRGEVSVHLALSDDLQSHDNPSAAYIYVEDPDALFAEWKAVAPPGELRAPEDTPWGMREMSYGDPDGNLLRIGRALQRAQ